MELFSFELFAAFGDVVFAVDLNQDDGDYSQEQKEDGNQSEGAAVGCNGGIKAGDYRHHHGGRGDDNAEQKRQVAVEEIRNPERGKVRHEYAYCDKERDDVQEAEYPAVRAEERRNRALAQAVAIFVLEMLEHAGSKISRNGTGFLGIESRRIRANSQVVIRIVVIQSIFAKLVPSDIVKPNERNQGMQHIAAIKAVQLQIQIVQEDLFIPGRGFVNHNIQVIFQFFTDLLSANLSIIILILEQFQEVTVTINATIRFRHHAISKQLSFVNRQIRAIHHQVHMHILIFLSKPIFQVIKEIIE